LATTAVQPLHFGLTPVFLSNDLALLDSLRSYLQAATRRPVRLVSRRTYQEITALLVTGQLDAAWICGYPFVQHRDALALLAVPVWRGDCLYRSYLISRPGRGARSIGDLAGDIHAFSDPDSNSGHLVTRALLAERQADPDRFFRRTFFTYGHRNVIRSVASGLAQSGSVDGYVLEVLREVEPVIGDAVEIVQASPWHGFPPVAIRRSDRADPAVAALRSAFLEMRDDTLGRQVLDGLRLDGFAERGDDLYDTIAANVDLVRAAAG
jgi:phosphonate transport system substrate-binding protein